MKTTLFIILSLLLNSCSEKNSVEVVLNINIDSINKAKKFYDKKELLSSLNTIELFHKKNKTGLKLNNPAEVQDINKAQSFFGCNLPEELVVLWRWHNGESTENFIWYHRFLSINESISQYKELVSLDYLNWKKNWIPVFEFQGEWYGVQCGNNTPKASPIIYYDIETGASVAYINLTTYMQVISRSIKKGGLKWKGSWWEEDNKILPIIHSELNPGLKFPYYIKQ